MPFRRTRSSTEDEANTYALRSLPTSSRSSQGGIGSMSGYGSSPSASGSTSATSAARSMRVRAAKARLALGAGARVRASVDGDERQGLLRGSGGEGGGEGDDTDGENSLASYSRALPNTLREEELDATSFDERGGFEDRQQQSWGATVGTPASGRSRSATTQTPKSKKGRWPWSGGESRDKSRTFSFAEPDKVRGRYPANVVRNQKYNLASFLPLVLYEQFKFFFNLYFLLVALSQFVPALKIGFIATYVAPLAFVLCVTIGKEAIDDYGRYKRDVESNSAPYQTLVSKSSPAALQDLAKRAKRRRGARFDDAEAQLGRRQGAEGDAHVITLPSSKIRVGDLVLLHKNQRVPADMVLLHTTSGETQPERSEAPQRGGVTEQDHFVLGDDDEEATRRSRDERRSAAFSEADDAQAANEPEEAGGTCFVRTDQLDGETDWKLRVAVEATQRMTQAELTELGQRAAVYAGAPIKDIHTFIGNFTLFPSPEQSSPPSPVNEAHPAVADLLGDGSAPAASSPPPPRERPIALSQQPQVAPLTAENVLWCNTVLAAGSAIGIVVYTGRETRAVMNTSHPGTKVGLLDLEVNRMAKILACVTFALSFGLVALNGFRGQWYVYIFRFLILFSSIIPISLRVNLDMGKTVYARQIMNDAEIPGTIVRTSTLPEELGRIEYLLSDKTGTLTQNEMELRKLHMGTMSYGWDSMDEITSQLAMAIQQVTQARGSVSGPASDGAGMLAAGLVSPPAGLKTNPMLAAGAMLGGRGRRDMSSRVKDVVLALALCHNVTPVINTDASVTYQASSPDEVAIVRWTESVGLSLVARTRTSMRLRANDGTILAFDILEIFPFTSESKRMGIVIRDRASEELTFYQKGADVVMARIVAQNDWLDEECGNMAREGLRTLVVGRKRMTEETWLAFERAYKAARVRVEDRNEAMTRVVAEHLERDLELLGLTGVEDKLQHDVKPTLELLRNAGVKVWMLTGDKIETATCIAISSKLVARNQYVHQVAKLREPEAARDMLDFLRSKLDCCLVIDGDSLQLCLDHHKLDFIELATQLSAVVACRCSPTQKADVARLIRAHTKKRVCCIGDGGNDVSMIQAADVGLGIVGKEGRQASLAADFSITQFSHLTKLLVWHGRNSYKRSAKLAQFVIHRGLIISIIQAVFSSIFYFAPIALYQGWLMVGYATVYTMAPVFSLVLDKDVSEDLALLYPELYKDLTKGRSLSAKTFAEWLMISVYQGGAIMLLSLVLFENEFLNIVSISFTALVVNELIMVALEITTWHVYMVLSEVVTLFFYCLSIAFLPEFFDLSFVLSTRFLWKVAVIIGVSSLPLYFIKVVKDRLAPPSYSKLAMA